MRDRIARGRRRIIGFWTKTRRDPYTYFVFALIFLAITLRLILIVWIPTLPTSDFWSYFTRAANIVDHLSYEAIPGRPDANFPPGYPILLATMFAAIDNRLLAAKILNAVSGGVAVGLMAYLTKTLFGRTAALIAALILAIYPRSLMTPLIIASENLFLPLLLAFVIILVRNTKDPANSRIPILAGILAGVLTLVRAVAYPLVFIWPLSKLRFGQSPAQSIKQGFIVVLIAHCVLLPWAVRNKFSLGKFTFLTSTAGQNLFIGNNPNAPGYWYPWVPDIEKVYPDWRSQDLMTRDRLAMEAAVDWIVSNPIEAAKLYIEKWRILIRDEVFVAYYSVIGENVEPPWPGIDVLAQSHSLKEQQTFLYSVLIRSYIILSTLEVFGAIALILVPGIFHYSQGRRGTIVLMGIGLLFPAVAAIFLATTRLRWPLTDLWIPFAAVLLTVAFENVRNAMGWVITAASALSRRPA